MSYLCSKHTIHTWNTDIGDLITKKNLTVTFANKHAVSYPLIINKRERDAVFRSLWVSNFPYVIKEPEELSVPLSIKPIWYSKIYTAYKFHAEIKATRCSSFILFSNYYGNTFSKFITYTFKFTESITWTIWSI